MRMIIYDRVKRNGGKEQQSTLIDHQIKSISVEWEMQKNVIWMMNQDGWGKEEFEPNTGKFSITCLEDKFFTNTEIEYLPEFKSNVFPLIQTA